MRTLSSLLSHLLCRNSPYFHGVLLSAVLGDLSKQLGLLLWYSFSSLDLPCALIGTPEYFILIILLIF